MLHSRIMNSKIIHIHERALRLVYSDYVSSFHKLLKKDQSLAIHHKDIQWLAIELWKCFHELSPKYYEKLLPFWHKYSILP